MFAKWISLLISIVMGVVVVQSYDNGLGLTPPMGFNTWNKFACDIDENIIRTIAKAMVDSGLKDLGYEYINLDDCWAMSRNETGFIKEDMQGFPSGMHSLVEYVHSLGLKFGLYSDAGTHTCAKRPGSLGYETKDAATYKQWKIDYLKVRQIDCWCLREFVYSIMCNSVDNIFFPSKSV
jgi:alpha-galactosidase